MLFDGRAYVSPASLYANSFMCYSDATVDLVCRKLTDLAREIHAAPLLVV